MGDSSTSAPQESPLCTKQTNIRVLHSRDKDHVSIIDGIYQGPNRPTKFACTGKIHDTVIEESLESIDNITAVRIRKCYDPKLLFQPISNYFGVTRIDLSCPVDTIRIFDWASCLPFLQFIRFGQGFFDVCKEQQLKKIEKSPNVTELVVKVDGIKFHNTEKSKRQSIQNKIDRVLDLSARYFTGLDKVHLILPEGPALDVFLNKVLNIRNNGTKSEMYRNKMLEFKTNSDRDQDQPNSRQTKRPASETKDMKRAKVETQTEPVPSRPEEAQVQPELECVDLCDDDEEETHSHPQIPTVSDPRLNRNLRTTSRKIGRESPSLLPHLN